MSSEITSAHNQGEEHVDHEGMNKRRIWNVFFVLLAITCVEFFIALVVAPHYHYPNWVNPLYIVLTLLKAFYIVGYFMHLKFEKVGLALAIIIPILFIIALILVLTNESHYWVGLRL